MQGFARLELKTYTHIRIKGGGMILQRKEKLVLGTLLSLLLIILAFIYLNPSNAQKEESGFRGMQWGTSIQQTQNMTLLAEERDTKFYVRDGEPLQMEDAAIQEIIYGFYKDRFYNATVYYKDQHNFVKIKEVTSRSKGKPCQPDPSNNKYVWDDSDLTYLLDYNENSGSGKLFAFFKPIQLEAELKR